MTNQNGAGTKDVEVAVVGAGLSGLTCALRLDQAGISTAVLEARERVGGRTLNAPLGDGKVVELGGQWIGPGQERVKALADELGIGTFSTHLEGDNLFLLRGRVSRYRGDVPRRAPFGFADFLQAKLRLERMARKVDLEHPARGAGPARWDTETPASWISRHMHTHAGRTLMGTAIEAILGVDPADISLLHLVFYIASAGCSLDALVATRGGAQQDRLEGGSQEISLRMAERLDARVHLEAPVSSIEQGAERVHITAGDQRLSARFVVVAVPPVLTAHIDYHPSLPGERLQLAQRMAPGTVIKCVAIYPEPFWRSAGLSGHATCDRGPVKAVFDNSPPNGVPGALLAFVLGRDARQLARQSSDDRRQAVLARLGELFGECALDPERYLEQSWADEPWTRGCYAGYFGPGGWSAYGEALRPPVGRVHWAGSETAIHWHGSMDGAVAAGERAAQEVLQRLGDASPAVLAARDRAEIGLAS